MEATVDDAEDIVGILCGVKWVCISAKDRIAWCSQLVLPC